MLLFMYVRSGEVVSLRDQAVARCRTKYTSNQLSSGIPPHQSLVHSVNVHRCGQLSGSSKTRRKDLGSFDDVITRVRPPTPSYS
jgi:hypothetical protein